MFGERLSVTVGGLAPMPPCPRPLASSSSICCNALFRRNGRTDRVGFRQKRPPSAYPTLSCKEIRDISKYTDTFPWSIVSNSDLGRFCCCLGFGTVRRPSRVV